MTRFGRKAARKIGLIGYPLSHSLSPTFQQAALDYYGFRVTYEKWEVAPGQISEAITMLKSPDCLGANVTIPHKEAIVPHLDAIDDFARKIGAVNTVRNNGGRLEGFNTDGVGFRRALEDDACFDPEGKRVVILGAGGGARAVAATLLDAGAAEVVIFNRRYERAASLVTSLLSAGLRGAVRAAQMDRTSLRKMLAKVDLLVNTTPVGMKNGPAPDQSPIPDDLVPASALIFDLVYNPPVTRLLAIAGSKGAQTLNGLPMLVYQGAAAFELWTGEKAPLGLMLERARLALLGRI